MKRPPLPSPAHLQLTPLIDVAFLVIIFFMALPMIRLDHKMEAHLPRKIGVRETPLMEPIDTVEIRVYMDGGEVRYRVGDHVASRPAGLEKVLRRLGPAHLYGVNSDGVVAWQDVLDMIDLLKALRYTRIAFRGERPPAPVLDLRRLPRPA